MLENRYQRILVTKLRELLPNCFIMLNDPQQYQGIPDILILFGNRWAMLETKRAANAAQRPNQDYYISQFNQWSFAAFINPSNEDDVLEALKSEMMKP